MLALSHLMVLLQLQISLSPCCCRVRAAAEVLRLLLRARDPSLGKPDFFVTLTTADELPARACTTTTRLTRCTKMTCSSGCRSRRALTPTPTLTLTLTLSPSPGA